LFTLHVKTFNKSRFVFKKGILMYPQQRLFYTHMGYLPEMHAHMAVLPEVHAHMAVLPEVHAHMAVLPEVQPTWADATFGCHFSAPERTSNKPYSPDM
jgi:hypothetical protein